MKEKSDIDKLFYELMGYYPSKSGAAYEILSTAILGLTQGVNSKYNQIRKGMSGTNYQLDGLLDGKYMVEAKDYTIRQDKVGRGDLQKLQGGLTDLSGIAAGIFASATDYTETAEKYAENSVFNPYQKEIIVTDIRPVVPEDLLNRIHTIRINMSVIRVAYEKGKYNIIFFSGERERFEQKLRKCGKESVEALIDKIYDEKGDLLTTIMDISLDQQPKIDLGNRPEYVTGNFDIDGYVIMLGELFHIKGFQYEIPVEESTEIFEIKKDGTPLMLISSERLGINKLITDVELKTEIKKILNNSDNTGKIERH